MGKSVTEAQEQWHPIQGPWLEARRDDPARVRADMIHIERGSPDFGFTATKHLDRTPARCSCREIVRASVMSTISILPVAKTLLE